MVVKEMSGVLHRDSIRLGVYRKAIHQIDGYKMESKKDQKVVREILKELTDSLGITR